MDIWLLLYRVGEIAAIAIAVFIINRKIQDIKIDNQELYNRQNDSMAEAFDNKIKEYLKSTADKDIENLLKNLLAQKIESKKFINYNETDHANITYFRVPSDLLQKFMYLVSNSENFDKMSLLGIAFIPCIYYQDGDIQSTYFPTEFSTNKYANGKDLVFTKLTLKYYYYDINENKFKSGSDTINVNFRYYDRADSYLEIMIRYEAYSTLEELGQYFDYDFDE